MWQLINLQVDPTITWQLIQPPGKPGHHVAPNNLRVNMVIMWHLINLRVNLVITWQLINSWLHPAITWQLINLQVDPAIMWQLINLQVDPAITWKLTKSYPFHMYSTNNTISESFHKTSRSIFKTIVFQGGLQPQSTYPKYSNTTDSSTNSVQLPNF